MFRDADVRRSVANEMSVLAMQGLSTSDAVTFGNRSTRLTIARTEIWSGGRGNGTLNVDLDCTGCRLVSTCPGDKCPRKDC